MPRRATSTSYGKESGNPKGRGPKPGAPNAGPPTLTMRERMRVILERGKAMKSVETILADPDHKHFASVFNTTLDRTEGKVPTAVDLTSKGEKVSGVVVLPATEEPKS